MAAIKSFREILAKTLQQYYFIIGDDLILHEEFISAFVSKIFNDKPDASAIVTFDLEIKETVITALNIIEEAGTVSMFNPVKLVIVKNAQLLKDEEARKLVDFLPKLPKDSYLLLIADDYPKEDKRKKEQNALLEIQRKNLVDTGLKIPEKIEWVIDYLKVKGKEIDRDTAEFIVDQSNNDLTAIKNELDKLLLLVGNRAVVLHDDYAEISGYDKNHDIWAVTGAIGENNPRQAFSLFGRIYENTSPELFMGAVFGEIRKIYLARYYLRSGKRDDECMRLLGKGFYYTKPKIKNFDRVPYDEMLGILRETDRKIKKSHRDFSGDHFIIMMEKIFAKIKEKNK